MRRRVYDRGLMRYAVLATATLLAATVASPDAHADGKCTNAPPASALSTWGAAGAPATGDTRPVPEESPVTRARDLLARARLLDEAATTDDKSAIEIAARLPTLRTTAKTARDRADRAFGPDRETLVSRAEDLEADLAVSEAEVTAKRRSAAENRRVARELRARAVQLVRDAPVEPQSTKPTCDPPYRYTADGRKVYRVECLK